MRDKYLLYIYIYIYMFDENIMGLDSSFQWLRRAEPCACESELFLSLFSKVEYKCNKKNYWTWLSLWFKSPVQRVKPLSFFFFWYCFFFLVVSFFYISFFKTIFKFMFQLIFLIFFYWTFFLDRNCFFDCVVRLTVFFLYAIILFLKINKYLF